MTNGQVPSWLNLKNSRLKLITHKVREFLLDSFSSFPLERKDQEWASLEKSGLQEGNKMEGNGPSGISGLEVIVR